jgi:hypothetical protein
MHKSINDSEMILSFAQNSLKMKSNIYLIAGISLKDLDNQK